MVKKFLRGIKVSFLLLIIISTLSSCANEMNIFEGNNNRQINFYVSIPEWKNMDSLSNFKTSRATPITDNSVGTDKSFKLIADQNDGAGNYSILINNQAVSYTNNIWKTTNDYYWSGIANKTISFYAYYPSTISNVSHTAGSAPTLLYTAPDNVSDQIDIMTSTNNNVSGNTNSSTPLTFNHIFAAIQFSVGSAGIGSGTISSISIGNVANSGTYTFGGGWSNVTGSKTFTISQSKTITGTSGEDIYSGTYTLMMIPQIINNVTITITYSNGSSLAKTISGSWEVGKIYNYKVSCPPRIFDYTGNVQTYTVPITGTYKLQTWGAQGGTDSSDSITAGKGGYAQGLVKLNKNQVLYIYIGGQGGPTASTGTAGYNGGGLGGLYSYGTNLHSGGGGGATHVASISGLLSTLSSNKNTIYLVAGGGGGYCHGGADNDKHYGGTGGGTNGGNSLEPYNTGLVSYGATQTTGYQFGKGQDGHNANGGGWGGEAGSGCGGGWFGGNASQQTGDNTNSGGSGGSGYIGGVSDGSMQNGVRSGNGYARITFVSAN